LILDNPFHVLGLPADCTTRELNRRVAQAKAFLRVGKVLEFPGDLYLSSHCHRNSTAVDRAVNQLHDGGHRIQWGLFWFTRGGPLNAHALRFLERGRVLDAYEALAKIESREVKANSAASLNNFGTVCLLMALDPPSGTPSRVDLLQRGLRAKAQFLGHLPDPDLVQFCSGVGDEIAARNTAKVIESFGDSLKRFLAESSARSIQVPGGGLVEALDSGGPRFYPIKATLGSVAREKIEQAIRACAISRRREPAVANEAARTLRAALQDQLPRLAEVTSEDDYLYRSLADKGAEELVSATTDYFNHFTEAEGISLKLIREVLPMGEYAAEIACGELASQRVQADLATLRSMEADQLEQARFATQVLAMGEWFAACDALWEDEGTAPAMLTAFVKTSLNPDERPGRSVIRSLEALKADGFPEILDMNTNVCQRLLSLVVRAVNAAPLSEGEELLFRLADVFDSQARILPVDGDCANRLRENVSIVQSNRANREAAPSASAGGSVSGIVVFLVVFVGLMLLLFFVPGIGDAAPQQQQPNRTPEALVESERRLDALEATNAALVGRIRTLETGRERDAGRIRELEAELTEAARQRGALEGRASEQEQQSSNLQRDLAMLRDEAVASRDREAARIAGLETALGEAGQERGALEARPAEQEQQTTDLEQDVAALRGETSEDRARLSAESVERMAGDQRGAWYTAGAVTLLLSVVGFVRWRGRRETGNLGKQFDESVGGLSGSLEEAAQQSARTLAALEELVGREPPSAEPDHKLVLLMCDEINRMENNLRHMDSATRGHKKLLGVVRRMKENLGGRGYQITELHGHAYDEGMAVAAEDWITDASLEKGRDVISWVKTPEVRFEGSIIQAANVQVTTGA